MCNCDIKAVVDSLLDMNNHGLWDEVNDPLPSAYPYSLPIRSLVTLIALLLLLIPPLPPS